MVEKPVNKQPRYLAYLLRLWQESPGSAPREPRRDPPLWRASLQSPQSEERLGFAGPEELFAYLREQLSTKPPAGGTAEGPQKAGTNSEPEEK